MWLKLLEQPKFVGQEGGIDAAIHAMMQLWERASTDCLLLIDASNAFNSLKRATALWNIRFICPPLGVLTISKTSEIFLCWVVLSCYHKKE